MLLSNITFSVSLSHAILFENALKSVFIPELQVKSKVSSVKLFKLLTEIENGGLTYSVQFFFDSASDFEDFEQKNKDQFLQNVQHKFVGNIVYFETLLEEI